MKKGTGLVPRHSGNTPEGITFYRWPIYQLAAEDLFKLSTRDDEVGRRAAKVFTDRDPDWDREDWDGKCTKEQASAMWKTSDVEVIQVASELRFKLTDVGSPLAPGQFNNYDIRSWIDLAATSIRRFRGEFAAQRVVDEALTRSYAEVVAEARSYSPTYLNDVAKARELGFKATAQDAPEKPLAEKITLYRQGVAPLLGEGAWLDLVPLDGLGAPPERLLQSDKTYRGHDTLRLIQTRQAVEELFGSEYLDAVDAWVDGEPPVIPKIPTGLHFLNRDHDQIGEKLALATEFDLFEDLAAVNERGFGSSVLRRLGRWALPKLAELAHAVIDELADRLRRGESSAREIIQSLVRTLVDADVDSTVSEIRDLQKASKSGTVAGDPVSSATSNAGDAEALKTPASVARKVKHEQFPNPYPELWEEFWKELGIWDDDEKYRTAESAAKSRAALDRILSSSLRACDTSQVDAGLLADAFCQLRKAHELGAFSDVSLDVFVDRSALPATSALIRERQSEAKAWDPVPRASSNAGDQEADTGDSDFQSLATTARIAKERADLDKILARNIRVCAHSRDAAITCFSAYALLGQAHDKWQKGLPEGDYEAALFLPETNAAAWEPSNVD